MKIKKEEIYSDHEEKLELIEEDKSPKVKLKKDFEYEGTFENKEDKWTERKSRYRCLMEKTTVCGRKGLRCT